MMFELKDGDTVVAAVGSHHGFCVFTKLGHVYEMRVDHEAKTPTATVVRFRKPPRSPPPHEAISP
jgi:hypothetical protein